MGWFKARKKKRNLKKGEPEIPEEHFKSKSKETDKFLRRRRGKK